MGALPERRCCHCGVMLCRAARVGSGATRELALEYKRRGDRIALVCAIATSVVQFQCYRCRRWTALSV